MTRLLASASALAFLAACTQVPLSGAQAPAEPLMLTGALESTGAPAEVLLKFDGLRAVAERVAPRLWAADLEFAKARRDELGLTHAVYRQTLGGLEVVGAEVAVHLDGQGNVYAASGVQGDLSLVARAPALTDAEAVRRAEALGYSGLTLSTPRLVYVLGSFSGTVSLAWELHAEGERSGELVKERVYVDAVTGGLAERQPLIHSALSRVIYTANNKQTLPGTQLMTEGGTSTDAVAKAAYDNTGETYEFYKTVLNRDSWDGKGAKLISTIHYGVKYMNAFWNGTQMTYGDGDGVQIGNFASSLDVTAHELTHGVTGASANLTYQNESGALNEGMSDIMAAATQTFRKSWVPDSATWIVGEDVVTPAKPGDGIRYMDTPTKDGQSKDYYPERYTGSSDNGGVHLNSGIANLAYKLMTTGGKHPRNKTTVDVPAIGLEKATKIFYKALTDYMRSSTNFAGGRTATSQAAKDLYGPGEARVVEMAWAAVGVGTAPAPACVPTDGVCDPGCNPIDPDCYCAKDGQCTTQCADLSKDPDCPKDCVKNSVCAVEDCPVPDPDCVDVGQGCSGELVCKSRKCVSDPTHPNTYCSKTCKDPSECPAEMECLSGTCKFKQAPPKQEGDTCEPTDRCADGLACTAPLGSTTLKCLKECVDTFECAAGFKCETGEGGVRFCKQQVTTQRPRPASTPEEPEADITGSCSAGPGMPSLLALGLSLLAGRRLRKR